MKQALTLRGPLGIADLEWVNGRWGGGVRLPEFEDQRGE